MVEWFRAHTMLLKISQKYIFFLFPLKTSVCTVGFVLTSRLSSPSNSKCASPLIQSMTLAVGNSWSNLSLKYCCYIMSKTTRDAWYYTNIEPNYRVIQWQAQQVRAAASQQRCTFVKPHETHSTCMHTHIHTHAHVSYLTRRNASLLKQWGPKVWRLHSHFGPRCKSAWLCNVHYIRLCTYMALYSKTVPHTFDRSPGSSGVYEVKRSQLVSVTARFRFNIFLARSPMWLCQERHSRDIYELPRTKTPDNTPHTVTQCFRCSWIYTKVLFQIIMTFIQVRGIFG